MWRYHRRATLIPQTAKKTSRIYRAAYSWLQFTFIARAIENEKSRTVVLIRTHKLHGLKIIQRKWDQRFTSS